MSQQLPRSPSRSRPGSSELPRATGRHFRAVDLAAGAFLAILAVTLVGCHLLASPSGPRLVETSFRLARPVAEGDRLLVASWTVVSRTRLDRRLLQLSGRLEGEEDAELPGVVTVRAEIRDLDTGRRRKLFRLVLDRSAENGFRKAKKFPRSVAAGSLVEVTVEPLGADLPEGALVSVCLDLVGKRKELKTFSSCAAGSAETTFSGIQATVFSPRCARSGCHDAETAEQGLVLEPGESFAGLVNVSAVQFPPDRRVRPGDPERSYLVKKLRGSSPIGGRMPLGGPFLADSQLAGIVEWIENGAADD